MIPQINALTSSLTPKTQIILSVASGIGSDYANKVTGTVHLLLAILKTPCVAKDVLMDHGIDFEAVSKAYERFSANVHADRALYDIVLSNLQEKAKFLECQYIGSEAILLAILDLKSCAACEILRLLGADLKKVEESLVSEVKGEDNVTARIRNHPFFSTLVQILRLDTTGIESKDVVLNVINLKLACLQLLDGAIDSIEPFNKSEVECITDLISSMDMQLSYEYVECASIVLEKLFEHHDLTSVIRKKFETVQSSSYAYRNLGTLLQLLNGGVSIIVRKIVQQEVDFLSTWKS